MGCGASSASSATKVKQQAPAPTLEDSPVQNKGVEAGNQTYTITTEPEMIPIGFKGMINDTTNHRLLVREGVDATDSRIVVIGSGYHLAVALSPTPAGVTPDIKDDFNPDDDQGKICFATILEICTSVEAATNVKIRKNPLDAEEKEAKGDDVAMDVVKKKRAVQLEEYKSNFMKWLRSLSTDVSATRVTFVRNVYPMNPDTKKYVEQTSKPVWCTGLGVDLCLDCGSGQCVLVDGVLGTQIFHSKTGESLKWNTEEGNEDKWTDEEIALQIENIRDIIKDNADFDGDGTMDRKIVAYGTGNWRKKHMETTWPRFKKAIMHELKVDFNLLPGHLEAKYGGISSLKLTAPYALECTSWIVVEMGSGSTQITRFMKQ